MKIFLSSTYLDLIEHRKAAVNSLRAMGEEVEHMEIFGARDEEPTKASLDELDGCDVLVGIYAYRYGTVPKGSKVSVTEEEYLHAMASKKIKTLVLVVEENHPWPPKLMDKNLTKIKKFKSKATSEHTPEYFTSPDNLASRVVAAVGRLAKTFNPKPILDSQALVYQSPKPTGSTLPKQEYFFGREKELKIISDAIAPESRTWGALIDGPGGIGKTALAIKAAHDATADFFDRKIFITAKVRELTAEGEAKLTDFTRPTYLAMLDELGKELGADGLEKLPPDDRPNELRLALAGKKALIIFDNLETLPEEERTRLFQFLSRLTEGNKAIVTSRRRSDVDARIVRLDRLAREEAMQLITELALKYPRLARVTQKEREDLYEITQGNPLFIRWIAGQLGREGSHCRSIAEACAFIDKAPKGNDPLEYIFGDLLETFSADETKVLAALTYFSLPAKLKWIAEMTGLPARAAETALEDLTDRSILTSDLSAQTYFLPPLTAKFIRTRRPEAVTQTGDALTNRAYALALQYGGDTNYEGFRTLDVEWDFTSAALPRLLTGDNARLQTVCGRLMPFLDFSGRWDEQLWLCEQAETRALAANVKEHAGRRAYEAGMAYYRRNQPAEVLACAARAVEHWQDSTPRNKAIAIQLRGIGQELNKDYPAAITAYREVVKIDRSSSPESDDVSIDLSNLADAEKANKDYPAAERDYREALRIAKIVKYQEGVATYTGNLAELALDREQWPEAESLAREALALAEKVGRQELIASHSHRLAQALLKQNQITDEALFLCRRAVEIFTRLRYRDLKEAQETLAEIERARGEK
jgi:tetratricopeptide (TPR) repeat protein